jgi:hypothetical protein
MTTLRQSTPRLKDVPTGDSSRRLTNDRATGRPEAHLIGPSSAANLADHYSDPLDRL